jgi:hypothetical protein
MKAPRPRSKLTGLLLCLGLGLVLATIAMIPVLLGGGQFKEGSYCTKSGIGTEPALREHNVGPIYIEGRWAGFPPSQSCKVYRVDWPGVAAPNVITGKDALEAYPHHLVAEGSYPKPEDYTWALIAFAIPPALWAIYSTLAFIRRRRPGQMRRSQRSGRI